MSDPLFHRLPPADRYRRDPHFATLVDTVYMQMLEPAHYTPTELRTRDTSTEPDLVIGYKGGNWICVRQEEWESPFDDDDVYFRVLITRETHGGA